MDPCEVQKTRDPQRADGDRQHQSRPDAPPELVRERSLAPDEHDNAQQKRGNGGAKMYQDRKRDRGGHEKLQRNATFARVLRDWPRLTSAGATKGSVAVADGTETSRIATPAS